MQERDSELDLIKRQFAAKETLDKARREYVSAGGQLDGLSHEAATAKMQAAHTAVREAERAAEALGVDVDA